MIVIAVMPDLVYAYTYIHTCVCVSLDEDGSDEGSDA